MKGYFVILFFLLLISCNKSPNLISLNSPDGKIKLEFLLEDGSPYYKINKDNKPVIEKSKLGIILKEEKKLDRNFKLIESSRTSYNSTWKPLYGEEKEILNNYNELNIILGQKDSKLKVIFRVFDDGIGFRYEINNQRSIEKYDIIDEKTEFKLAKNDTAWWIPGFSYRRYEFLYAKTQVNEISKETYSEKVEDIKFDTIGIDADHKPLSIKK